MAAAGQQVGKWQVDYTASDGAPAREVFSGKLVLQDNWTLVLDETNRAVKFACPNVKVSSVRPY